MAAGSRAGEKEEGSISIGDETGPGCLIPASTVGLRPLYAKPHHLSESDLPSNSPKGTEAPAESFDSEKRRMELDDDELEEVRAIAAKSAAEELARLSAWTAVYGKEAAEAGGDTGPGGGGSKVCSGAFNTISNPFYHPRYYEGKRKVVLRTLKKVPAKEGAAADGGDGSSSGKDSEQRLASSAAATKAFDAEVDLMISLLGFSFVIDILGFHREQKVLVLPHFKNGDLGEKIRSAAEGGDTASWPPGLRMDCVLKLLKGGAESLLALGEGNVFFHGDIKVSDTTVGHAKLSRLYFLCLFSAIFVNLYPTQLINPLFLSLPSLLSSSHRTS